MAVSSRSSRGLGAIVMAAGLLAGCAGAQPEAPSTSGIPTSSPGATVAPSLVPSPAPTVGPTLEPSPTPSTTPAISVAWTRHFGTAAEDTADAIAVDDRAITVAGTTSGTLEGKLQGSNDIFLRRYDFAGEVVWTRQFGTPGQDWAKDVAADTNGITVLWASDGSFSGTARANAKDLFLRRFDRSGTVLWTTSYVTPKDEEPGGIAADAAGLTVVGTTQGVGGDLVAAPTSENVEAIVLRYDLAGRLVWTRQFGSPEPDGGDEDGYRLGVIAGALATDSAGFTIGGSTGGDLAAPNAGPTSSSGDAFVRRYDLDGNILWTRQWGQEGSDVLASLAADNTGITAVGFTADAYGEKPSDAFILRYDRAGTLVWSEIFGTPDSEIAYGVDGDSAALTVTGYTYGALDGTHLGAFDVFVRRYDRAGKLIWRSQFGTSAAELGMDVAADAAGFTIVGHTSGSLGGPGKGELDIFVRRYSI